MVVSNIVSVSQGETNLNYPVSLSLLSVVIFFYLFHFIIFDVKLSILYLFE